MTMETIERPGLQGVVAAETRLSRVDGERGELIIAGYALDDLAPRATFEEVLFLLWNDRLPTQREYHDLRAQMAAQRALHPQIEATLHAVANAGIPLMDALRMGAGLLNLSVSADDDPQQVALSIVAALPTILAQTIRLRAGEEPVQPHEDLSHVANFLYMLDGAKPSDPRVRALETYFNTVVDHGLNASTLAARVAASTGSDMVSAIVAAIGTLKGPLHGGAPGPALDLVFEIGQRKNAEPILRQRLEAGERLMGFGHRVYKVRDPRADALNSAAEQFFVGGLQADLYVLARHVEEVALRLLEEYKPGRRLQTNVEFYTALVLHGVGLSTEIFTPTFALARAGGWTAHVLEHMANGRLLRPLARYVGTTDRHWTPLVDR